MFQQLVFLFASRLISELLGFTFRLLIQADLQIQQSGHFQRHKRCLNSLTATEPLEEYKVQDDAGF